MQPSVLGWLHPVRTRQNMSDAKLHRAGGLYCGSESKGHPNAASLASCVHGHFMYHQTFLSHLSDHLNCSCPISGPQNARASQHGWTLGVLCCLGGSKHGGSTGRYRTGLRTVSGELIVMLGLWQTLRLSMPLYRRHHAFGLAT